MYNFIQKSKKEDKVSSFYRRINLADNYNNMLDNAKTNEERIEIYNSIRSKMSLDPVSDLIMKTGQGRLVVNY